MKTSMKPGAKVAISLPGALLEQIDEAANDQGRTRSALIAEILSHWLKDRKLSNDEQTYVEGYLRVPESNGQDDRVLEAALATWGEWK